MTFLREVQVTSADSPSIDAFSRTRVSNIKTLFDSKFLKSKRSLFWDESQVSGSGTSSVFDEDNACVSISVSATTAGKFVRQTFQRFNYQSGKSQLIFVTFSNFETTSGVTKTVGAFDDNNGLFFKNEGGIVSVIRRSSTAGSAVDNEVTQGNWNLDKLDGTGRSGITLDFSKAQIGVIDYGWLGVNRVRFGFVVNGLVYYCHEFLSSNLLSTVWASKPNFPIRYEIENDGTGAASTFDQICSSVASEGGDDERGILRCSSTKGVQLDADAANVLYACIGIRQKSTHLDMISVLKKISVLAENNDDYEWQLILNPTIAGTFTYADVDSNSYLQEAFGDTPNTVSGGTLLDGGFVQGNGDETIIPSLSRNLGSAIDGSRDEFVLCIRPLSTGLNAQATVSWLESS